ncbi:hypothetical protein EJ04DRAFT_558034 [Polyplosphaeria fusca]|uniref:Uncharacterized protein n=1 Tax=Polyplosphaeria fusca TaxID=682080 RepID=A0A9P4RCX5_9PLEO|nr:hypothetical protein EJ04DRAFT_558034 [Polyplosphaeria fusca]
MLSDLDSPTSPISPNSPPSGYFSIVPSLFAHYSAETPSTTRRTTFSCDIFSEPTNPLLALRELPLHYQPSHSIMDASRIFELQITAAHPRSATNSGQDSPPASSLNSSASSSQDTTPPLTFCCCRCRRGSITRSYMVQVGLNSYYCNHCASMVGYNSG